MADERVLAAQLLALAARWEDLAQEARQWVQDWQPGDLPPVYLQGCADQLEHNARELSDLAAALRDAPPRPNRPRVRDVLKKR